MHSWKKKLVVSQLALACTLAITSQVDWPPESPDNQYHLNK